SAKKLLTENGILSLVMPQTEGEEFIRLAIKNEFFLKRKIQLFPKRSKKYNRIIFDLCLNPAPTLCQQLIIREENNEYTEQYRELTKDFYLAF
ncbi:MAG: tRNA (adenosine(37)-N6)-methyltransferase TrmM, partial [Bacteroidales bacterium]|nr:tRNA (adenosine(37)-N6)-methyltransferase TrmM [Bacteroidales bacterium]